ncbi:MAG: S-methyl-5-thioribose-1-phosphate isomerase [Acidobacteriota bacterium]|nr:S-methyl-5-thioribose-1-phosphate isomerase [Blastocatellia bacterium]MDW8411796.1 S-methyl-5-thioribose-1-phosphate isomerase [Acidobacteriota bacterium]
MIKTVEWTGDSVVMIDQRLLPEEEVYRRYDDYRDVAAAIRNMTVRGAPAIGVAAAFGVALGARQYKGEDWNGYEAHMSKVCDELATTRPTAVNLFWAIEQMKAVLAEARQQKLTPWQATELLVERAKQIHASDIEANERLGRYGAELLPAKGIVLTHCNAGALATAGYGTALGVIRAAIAAGKQIQVYADETRPLLQGARLTCWELQKDNIPVTLITDNMSGYFMKQGLIKAVVVGADRIAANGDVANKIGTYMLAVLAQAHSIPFYVAAPTSTCDLSIPSGEHIPIERRANEEVTELAGRRIAPQGVAVANPAFDVTPNEYITAIITEKGVAFAPYIESLKRLLQGEN